jgi:uncharacterized membrane protein (DUF2068 family)
MTRAATTEIGQGVSSRAAGVRLIVLYKLGKAALFAVLAIVLVVLISCGYVERAHELATAIRDEAVHHWSVKLAELAMGWLTIGRVWWIIAALLGDSAVSAVEGWALGRGYSWAAWLVVAATSLLLPVEIIEMSYRTTIGRVLLFFVNLGIVLYLLKRAMKDHHERHPHA